MVTKIFSSLIDFGTAMKTERQTEHLLGGTKPYMYPSQYLQDAKAREGQDWYARRILVVGWRGRASRRDWNRIWWMGLKRRYHKLRQIGYRDFEVQIIQEFVNVATKQVLTMQSRWICSHKKDLKSQRLLDSAQQKSEKRINSSTLTETRAAP